MSSLLPSPNDDYAAPADMRLNRAAWDAALVSVGTRLRALEAVKADFEALIALGTSQALAVISENVEPQLASVTAALDVLEQAMAEAEDTILQIITGSVPASAVIETADRLWLTPTLRDLWNAKVSAAQLEAQGDALLDALDTALTEYEIPDETVTNDKLRQSAAVSILGRSANSIGAPADIVAGANDRLLARVGNALAFVQMTAAMVPDGLITGAKIANDAIATAKIPDGAVTLAKLDTPVAVRPTSSSYPVGTVIVLMKTNSGVLADGATISGSNLAAAQWVHEENMNDGVSQLGTWRNISGGGVGQWGAGFFRREG
jgi:hypothetical protein